MKKEEWNIKKNSGQSLIEVLVSLGIFALVVTAIFTLFYGGQSLSVDSANAQNAAEYASEALEAIRTMRDRDWASLTDGQHGLVLIGGQWEFTTTTNSDSRDIFTRVVSIKAIDVNTKQASTSVSWQTDPLRPQKVELFERLTNWRNPLVLSGVCSSDPLSGNWASPQVLGSADLGPGNQGTDLVIRLPYVYVSGVAADAGKPDIFVFNVSNPSQPVQTATLNIGAGGINALALKDDHLYAASANNSKELIIFDISTPGSISEVGFFDLDGDADALSVFVFNGTAAVGRKEGNDRELAFVDVSSPGQPNFISQFSTGNGAVNDITAGINLLYAATKETTGEIWTYDISNPSNPSFISSYNVPAASDSISIFIQDIGGVPANLLIGNENSELVVVGATTTDQMYVRSRINLGGKAKDITCVEGDLAFLATTNSTKEFMIVNISNPDNIFEQAYFNFPQEGTGIDYANNKIFMSVRSNDALRIIGPGP